MGNGRRGPFAFHAFLLEISGRGCGASREIGSEHPAFRDVAARGANAVGLHGVIPDHCGSRAFIKNRGHGPSIFRIFVRLNLASNMRVAMEATRRSTM